MAACAPASIFDLREERPLIPVRFGIVVIRETVASRDPLSHARVSSATQTMEDESTPPLSSARTGELDRRRRLTACLKALRKCSSYSASVRYRIRLPGPKSQYFEHHDPCFDRANERRWRNSKHLRDTGSGERQEKESYPATYSSSRSKEMRGNRESSGSRIVLQVIWSFGVIE